MTVIRRALVAGAAFLAVGVVGIAAVDRPTRAADHLDPPARTDPDVDSTPDMPADIADVYAWHTASSVIIAVTFSGPQSTALPASYDRDVLYTINVSNDSVATTPEYKIETRFGQDGAANGVQIAGLPGVTGTIVGPVESNLNKDGVLARAGLFDDPFFFDLQGFRTTRSTGVLSFNKNRNFFAGQNLTAIVLQIPRARLENGTNPIRIWATTARFGGQK
jgi:hypothetical protein